MKLKILTAAVLLIGLTCQSANADGPIRNFIQHIQERRAERRSCQSQPVREAVGQAVQQVVNWRPTVVYGGCSNGTCPK